MPPRRSNREDCRTRTLKDYTSKLSHEKVPFPCPLCKTLVRHSKFESHCRFTHLYKPRLECVWCLGAYSWGSGRKHEHVDLHLIECWYRFREKLKYPTPPPTDTTLPLRIVLLEPKFRDAKMSPFDHDDRHLPLNAHMFPALVDLDRSPIPFRDATLNRATSCVRLYLDSNPVGQFEWFHVSVRIPAYARFLEAIENPNSHCFTLPFACWCDGGTESEARYRQHRHMIVGCTLPKYFKDHVWNTIKVPKRQKPRSGYRALFYTPIDNALHLVNILVYVSNRQSRCTFSSVKGPRKNNHFYLAESLPKDYRLPLTLQWDGGLYELLVWQCQKLNKGKLVRAPGLHRVGGRWRLRIKDIPDLEQGLVMPVYPDLEPCGGTSSQYLLHLMDGQTLRFDLNGQLAKLSKTAWLQRQAQLGNVLYHAVGERLWTPSHAQQEMINEFKPVVDRNRELEARVTRLEEEGERWRTRCERAEGEVRTLLEKMNRMNEGEISRLRRENAELRRENAELRRGPPPSKTV